MRFGGRTEHAQEIARRGQWQRWFAVYPVTIRDADQTVWWEHVERKTLYVYLSWDDGWGWITVYRNIGSDVDYTVNKEGKIVQSASSRSEAGKPTSRITTTPVLRIGTGS